MYRFLSFDSSCAQGYAQSGSNQQFVNTQIGQPCWLEPTHRKGTSSSSKKPLPAFEDLPLEIQDFVRKVLTSMRQNEQLPLEDPLEEQMSLEDDILEVLRLERWEEESKPVGKRRNTTEPEQCRAPKMARTRPSMVFIYDIDDVAKLSFKIINAIKRMFPKLKRVATAVETSIDFLAEKFFELNEEQDVNKAVMNIKDDDFGGKVEEYLKFKRRWERSGSNIIYEFIKDFEEDITDEEIDEFLKPYEQRWQNAKRCLQAISDKSLKNTYDNVILSDMIGYGAGQLLLSGLDSEVPLENIYSSHMTSKDQVLERIQRDYGEDCSLFVVTSDAKTIAAAEKKNILVWRVEDTESLDALHAELKAHMLE